MVLSWKTKRSWKRGAPASSSEGGSLWSSEACTGLAGTDIAVDGQGDVVAIGVGAGTLDQNVRLCKFTADGAFRRGKDIGTTLGDDWGHALRILPDDRILVAGDLATESSDAWLALSPREARSCRIRIDGQGDPVLSPDNARSAGQRDRLGACIVSVLTMPGAKSRLPALRGGANDPFGSEQRSAPRIAGTRLAPIVLALGRA